jgi:hypothetical protein
MVASWPVIISDMMNRWTLGVTGIGLMLTVGCAKNNPAPSTPTSESPSTAVPAERPLMTLDACIAKGGTVHSDPGDGRVHRPTYRCLNGRPPIGTIPRGEGVPVLDQGGVCCMDPRRPFAIRPEMTEAECTAKGGAVVVDPGDGSTHQPEYRCQNGQPPIGTIRTEEGEPIYVEGAVCCIPATP